ncbi:hypothetical protein SEVIR_1G050701v4 [Setaria viridis]
MSTPEVPERDRLSELPDDYLHRILRFLDTQQVITQLSSLSRRWQYLWATMPFVTLRSGSEKFGNLLLLLRDGTVPLHAFCLHSCDGKNFDHAHRWLRHALTREFNLLRPGRSVSRA